MSDVYKLAGNSAKAIECIDRAVAEHEKDHKETGSFDLLATALMKRGKLLDELGNPTEARESFTRAEKLLRKEGLDSSADQAREAAENVGKAAPYDMAVGRAKAALTEKMDEQSAINYYKQFVSLLSDAHKRGKSIGEEDIKLATRLGAHLDKDGTKFPEQAEAINRVQLLTAGWMGKHVDTLLNIKENLNTGKEPVSKYFETLAKPEVLSLLEKAFSALDAADEAMLKQTAAALFLPAGKEPEEGEYTARDWKEKLAHKVFAVSSTSPDPKELLNLYSVASDPNAVKEIEEMFKQSPGAAAYALERGATLPQMKELFKKNQDAHQKRMEEEKAEAKLRKETEAKASKFMDELRENDKFYAKNDYTSFGAAMRKTLPEMLKFTQSPEFKLLDDPYKARVLHNMGSAYTYLKEYEPAIEYLEKSKQLDPQARTIEWLGQTYANFAEELKAKGGKEKEDKARLYEDKARLYANKGMKEYEQAKAKLTEESAPASRQEVVDERIARLRKDLGELLEAPKPPEEEKKPEAPSTHTAEQIVEKYAKGWMMSDPRDWMKSKQSFESLQEAAGRLMGIMSDPGFNGEDSKTKVHASGALGEIQALLDKHDQALVSLDAAIEGYANPNDSWALTMDRAGYAMEKADVLEVKLKNSLKALEALQKANELMDSAEQKVRREGGVEVETHLRDIADGRGKAKERTERISKERPLLAKLAPKAPATTKKLEEVGIGREPKDAKELLAWDRTRYADAVAGGMKIEELLARTKQALEKADPADEKALNATLRSHISALIFAIEKGYIPTPEDMIAVTDRMDKVTDPLTNDMHTQLGLAIPKAKLPTPQPARIIKEKLPMARPTTVEEEFEKRMKEYSKGGKGAVDKDAAGIVAGRMVREAVMDTEAATKEGSNPLADKAQIDALADETEALLDTMNLAVLKKANLPDKAWEAADAAVDAIRTRVNAGKAPPAWSGKLQEYKDWLKDLRDEVPRAKLTTAPLEGEKTAAGMPELEKLKEKGATEEALEKPMPRLPGKPPAPKSLIERVRDFAEKDDVKSAVALHDSDEFKKASIDMRVDVTSTIGEMHLSAGRHADSIQFFDEVLALTRPLDGAAIKAKYLPLIAKRVINQRKKGEALESLGRSGEALKGYSEAKRILDASISFIETGADPDLTDAIKGAWLGSARSGAKDLGRRIQRLSEKAQEQETARKLSQYEREKAMDMETAEAYARYDKFTEKDDEQDKMGSITRNVNDAISGMKQNLIDVKKNPNMKAVLEHNAKEYLLNLMYAAQHGAIITDKMKDESVNGMKELDDAVRLLGKPPVLDGLYVRWFGLLNKHKKFKGEISDLEESIEDLKPHEAKRAADRISEIRNAVEQEKNGGLLPNALAIRYQRMLHDINDKLVQDFPDEFSEGRLSAKQKKKLKRTLKQK
jgi:tetratricopeptide (TPR) repeat protein